MTGRNFTICFLLAWIAVAVVYDLFALWYWGRESTISVVVCDIARRAPALAIAVGVIIGHIFWPIK